MGVELELQVNIQKKTKKKNKKTKNKKKQKTEQKTKEHHLQAVISASQLDTPNTSHLYIPTPDASKKVPDYTQIYTTKFHYPSKLIRSILVVDHSDEYEIDDEDFGWIEKYNSKGKKITEDQVESLITAFETASREQGETIEAIQDAYPLPQGTSSVAQTVFDYWKAKRAKSKYGTCLNTLKAETLANDPQLFSFPLSCIFLSIQSLRHLFRIHQSGQQQELI